MNRTYSSLLPPEPRQIPGHDWAWTCQAPIADRETLAQREISPGGRCAVSSDRIKVGRIRYRPEVVELLLVASTGPGTSATSAVGVAQSTSCNAWLPQGHLPTQCPVPFAAIVYRPGTNG